MGGGECIRICKESKWGGGGYNEYNLSQLLRGLTCAWTYLPPTQDKLHWHAFPWSISRNTRRQHVGNKPPPGTLGLFSEYNRGQTTQGFVLFTNNEAATQQPGPLLWHPTVFLTTFSRRNFMFQWKTYLFLYCVVCPVVHSERVPEEGLSFYM